MTFEPGAAVTVTTTYLHIPARELFRPAFVHAPDTRIMQAHEPLPAFYRFLYGTVGQGYYWRDRDTWTDEQLYHYLSRPAVTLLVLYMRGTPAGYIELNADSDEPGTEVAYFGLIRAFHGQGLGKHLLSAGVQRAFDDGAQRVWVHTCTLDGPYALGNYERRGFSPYRTTSGQAHLSPREL